jgi:hypothetical protein
MPRLKALQKDEGLPKSQQLMADLESKKMLLNIFRGMANSPAGLSFYLQGSGALKEGKLDAKTREAWTKTPSATPDSAGRKTPSSTLPWHWPARSSKRAERFPIQSSLRPEVRVWTTGKLLRSLPTSRSTFSRTISIISIRRMSMCRRLRWRSDRSGTLHNPARGA